MTRHAVVALTVAVAVGGLTAPTALANSTPGSPSVPNAVPVDPAVTGVTVNGGRDVVLGTTERKTFTVTVHGSDVPGLQFADVDLLGPGSGFYTTDTFCETATACTTTFTVDPHRDPYNDNIDLANANANAGRWYAHTLVDTNDGASLFTKHPGGFLFKRAAALTVNAAPEPVAKGGTITVTGKLTRANWDTYRYAGYTGQSVALQFRPKAGDTYTTVKTLRTDGTGNLRTTVKAAADGYWRWSFTGTTTTAPKNATGDYVEVR